MSVELHANDSREEPHPPGAVKPISVFFSASSFPSNRNDWKSVFIRNLAEALARREDIELNIWAPRGECSGGVNWATTAKDQFLLARLMRLGGIAHLLRTRPALGILLAARMLLAMRFAASRTSGQLHHVNWLQNAIALPQDGKPLLVSALGSDMKLLGYPMVRALLRRVFRHRQVRICPNAEWMVAPLRESFADLATVEAVPLGIDERWFSIRRRPTIQPARWLAVTRLTEDKIGELLTWGAPCFAKESGRQLHVFGPQQEPVNIPDWVHYHGAATPNDLLNHWFPEATGLITLSRHSEGRPQVMLEAMASALPVIASDLRAHSDLLTDGQTGVICRSAGELGRQLESLERIETNLQIGEAARQTAKARAGTWQDCADRYHRIYLELLGAKAR